MTEFPRWPARLAAGLFLLAAAAASQAPAATGPEVEAGAVAATASGVGPVTHLPLPRFVSMRGETANARRGPSLDQRVDWEFRHPGMPLEITAEYGNWRRVRDVDGKGGWVHHALLSGTRTALVTGSARVALRDKPEEGGRIVAVAEPGAVGRLDACAGAWCRITAAGREGWLPRAVLWGVGAEEVFD